jgi:PAS domain S-box-containing protein
VLRRLAGAVLVIQPDGQISYANPWASTLLGDPQTEIAGRHLSHYVARAQAGELEHVLASPEASGGVLEVQLRRADGQIIPVLLRCAPLRRHARSALVVAVTDLSEIQHLYGQLERAQRLEGLGTLAAGIAHDFNNSLTIILGYNQLAVNSLESQSPVAVEHLNTAISEVRRAADLVRQLLLFGRRSYAKKTVIDLSELVGDHLRVISRALPETIVVNARVAATPALTFADATQAQQVVVNLSLNARDAMPDGGTLSIDLDEVDARETYRADELELRPGRYYAVTVSDTGHGIPAEIAGRIFDPFFSTKTPERGSGLGLSVVWGIMEQHNGHVTVRSTPGEGTRFTVYWPLFEERRAAPRPAPPDEVQPGSGTILLIEDNTPARAATTAMLEVLGYTTLVAATGEEGVAVLRAHSNDVTLVLSDLVLPNLRGPGLVAALREIAPNVRVLFISGYSTIDEEQQLKGLGVDGILMKPFDLVSVSVRLQQALNRPSRAPSSG